MTDQAMSPLRRRMVEDMSIPYGQNIDRGRFGLAMLI
jgi:hypothetical protein